MEGKEGFDVVLKGVQDVMWESSMDMIDGQFRICRL